MTGPTLRTNANQTRSNGYPGQCAVCHTTVPAMAGSLTNEGGRWIVRHLPGECPAPKPQEPVSQPVSTFPVPEARYTITFADGSYKTLRVERQDEHAGFMPGRVLLAYLSGSDNESSYTSFAHVDENGVVHIWRKHQANESLREAVKVLLDSPQAAAESYAQHSGNCYVCGRTLTTPESIAAGIGPVCAGKVSW